MNRTLTLTSAAFGLALLLIGAPAYASSEAPMDGTPRVIAAPTYTTAGAEGAPEFAAPAGEKNVVIGMPSLPTSGEDYVAPRV